MVKGRASAWWRVSSDRCPGAGVEDLRERRVLEPWTCRQKGGVQPGTAAAAVTSGGTEGQDPPVMPAGHLPSVL